MLGLWPTPFHHYVDDLEYERALPAVPDTRKDHEDGLRNSKRQRRSIFFTGPDSDSEDDDDDHLRERALGSMKPGHVQLKLAMVPATPYSANPLYKGAFALTPSFPRRSSSPCLELDKEFVAVHEEANAGFRSYMEDRSAKMTVDGIAYLGVFDGHGGIDASTFLQRHLLHNIQARLQPGCDVHDAMTNAYSATNAAFRATGSIQGSTATTIILQKGRLIAANVGDSPAFVVKRSGEVYSVIQEHKIEGEEAARIAAQGVPIYRSPTGPAYMGTPDGTRWLNMSRAFGDFVYPAISCEPHVCSLDVSDGRYLVMGSDGLTEKWSVAEAAQYVTQLAADGWGLSAMCQSVVQQSLARGSTDNISCMIVDLEAFMLHAEAAEPTKGAAASASLLGIEDRTFVQQAVEAVDNEEARQQRLQAGCNVGQTRIDAAYTMDDAKEFRPLPQQAEGHGGRRSPGQLSPQRRGPGSSCGAEGLGKRSRDEDAVGLDVLFCEETPMEDQQLPGSPHGSSDLQQQSSQADGHSTTVAGDACDSAVGRHNSSCNGGNSHRCGNECVATGPGAGGQRAASACTQAVEQRDPSLCCSSKGRSAANERSLALCRSSQLESGDGGRVARWDDAQLLRPDARATVVALTQPDVPQVDVGPGREVSGPARLVETAVVA